jgi:hypothetical protein
MFRAVQFFLYKCDVKCTIGKHLNRCILAFNTAFVVDGFKRKRENIFASSPTMAESAGRIRTGLDGVTSKMSNLKSQTSPDHRNSKRCINALHYRLMT